MKKLKRAEKGERVFGTIFLVIGVFEILLGIFLANEDSEFFKTAVRLKAEVVECNTSSKGVGRNKRSYTDVYVDYEYAGKEYEHIEVLKSDSLSYNKGSMIDIYIEPNNPTVALTQSETNDRTVMKVGGLLIICLGIFLYVLDIRKIRKRKQLLKNGIVIHAQVKTIFKSKRVEIFGKTPYALSCEYYDTTENQNYKFVSESVWNKLNKYIYEDDDVEVIVMLNNFKEYYVNIDKLWKTVQARDAVKW